MIYSFSENRFVKRECSRMEDDNDFFSVCVLSPEEFFENSHQFKLDENTNRDCFYGASRFRTNVDVHENYCFCAVHILNIQRMEDRRERMGFLLKENLLVVLIAGEKKEETKSAIQENRNHKIIEEVLDKFRGKPLPEILLLKIWEAMTLDGYSFLGVTEENIIKMEKNVVEGRIWNGLNKEIVAMRGELFALRSYYEQLHDLAEELKENGLFQGESVKHLRTFLRKTEHLSKQTMILIDNLVHLREALEAALNYSLNQIMKMFTVVTTIFLPLTLIVGWYGMNFTNMPELTWRYGYVFVISLSIFIILLCFLYFKKKNLL